MNEQSLYLPRWELPAGVRAFVTTRSGGFSSQPWDSFNLAQHVDDDPHHVAKNRAHLQKLLEEEVGAQQLSQQWLNQIHGNEVYKLESNQSLSVPQADAIYTRESGISCGILTADCLPVLFCSVDGQEIAAAHAGWRGLLNGVLEQTLACFDTDPQEILVYLGPAIGPCHFEVGAEVRTLFLESAVAVDLNETSQAFVPKQGGEKFLANLYALAGIRLRRAGITQLTGEPICTVCDETRWFSYRRSALTGRNASLIIKAPY